MIFIDSVMTDASKKWLRDTLHNQDVIVTFKKKDGTIRDMRCTLSEKLIQPYERKENSTHFISPLICPHASISRNSTTWSTS